MKSEKAMLFSRRDLFKITFPLVIQQILAVTIGMVDTMMVSEAGEAAVSGVSLVNTLDTILVLAFGSLVSGGAVVVSQFLGRKSEEAARAAAKQLLYTATAVAIVISLAAVLFGKPLLSLLFGSVESDVMYHAENYFFFVALSFPFLAINNAGGALYRAMGNSLMSMLISLIMNLFNVCGNALLIYGLEMGAAGAAIATLASRILGTVITLLLIRQKKNVIYVDHFLKYRPDFPIIKEILRIGIPNGIENSMFQFGKLLTQSLISSMGTAAIAANAVALSLANYQYMPGTAFSNAMVIVVGRCIGAEEKKQAKHYSRVLVGITYLCLWAVVLATFLFAKPIIGIYDLSPEATEIAHQLILYHAIWAALIWPIAFTLPSALRAASDVRFPLVVSMFSMWTFRVAFSYIFSLESITFFGITLPGLGMGTMGVWVAMTVDWVFRTILFSVRYLSGKWLTVYRPIRKAKDT